jgi:hypothetical protein
VIARLILPAWSNSFNVATTYWNLWTY